VLELKPPESVAAGVALAGLIQNDEEIGSEDACGVMLELRKRFYSNVQGATANSS
jgi:hypothetical protein